MRTLLSCLVMALAVTVSGCQKSENPAPQPNQLHGDLKRGANPVGFKTFDTVDDQNKVLRVAMWYPAKAESLSKDSMRIQDYVQVSTIGGPSETAALTQEFKSTMEFIGLTGQSTISAADFAKVMSARTWARRDAEMKAGLHPLVLIDTEPVSLVVTCEFLASHGFVVAAPAMRYPAPTNDAEFWLAQTRGFESTLQAMIKQNYVNTDKISTLGFGGGAISSFYAIMRSGKIKAMANIEGGIFMPESKITLSSDYKPADFHAPMLHIVTPGIISGESTGEFNAITSTKFRVTVKVGVMRHHDYLIYGCVAKGVLRQRGENSETITAVFGTVHRGVLDFLNNWAAGVASYPGSQYTFEKFN